MTKLKKFKETVPPWMKLSFIDVVEMLDNSPTKKFMPMLVEIFNSSFESRIEYWGDSELIEIKSRINKKLPHVSKNFGDEHPSFFYILNTILDNTSDTEIEIVNDFINQYERKQICGIDISQIKTIEQIENISTVINIKNIGKEFSKQTHVDMDNDEWLVVRPLTYEASLKYGANTRWCTASRDNPYQYFDYTKNSVLGYCINKKTGYKVAFHIKRKDENVSTDISFWNASDDRIDSLSANISSQILCLIKEIYSSSETKTNKQLGCEYWKKSHDLHFSEHDDEIHQVINTTNVINDNIRTVNQ